MKKKSFLSGVNAKLALAAVALTSVMFTSCEKEEFNVAPVELDPASATIAVTVYDLGDRSIITEGLNITGDTEVKAGADGKIAPETRKFTATKKDYLPGEGQAVIPALNKGQFAFVPVNIFATASLILDFVASGCTKKVYFFSPISSILFSVTTGLRITS